MPNRTNRLMVTELTEYLRELPDMVFIGFQGLSAEEACAFRSELRSGGTKMRVIKNSVTRIALKEMGLEGPAMLIDGPMAVLHGEEIISVARRAAEFGKKHRKLLIKGGVVAGEAVTGAEVIAYSKLGSREALLGTLLGVIIAPATRLVGVLSGAGGALARAIKAASEKAEETGESEEAPAEAPAEG